jgi:hypothetical protein
VSHASVDPGHPLPIPFIGTNPVSETGSGSEAASLPPRLDPAAIEAPLFRRSLEHGVFSRSAADVLEVGPSRTSS